MDLTEEAKQILAEPQRAQKMQRALNAKNELRNAQLSTALLLVCTLGFVAIQIWRYAENGRIDYFSLVFTGLVTLSFLFTLLRLRRSLAAYIAETRTAA